MVRPGGVPSTAHLDITRLTQDTGHQPADDTDQATADHLTRLRAGNER